MDILGDGVNTRILSLEYSVNDDRESIGKIRSITISILAGSIDDRRKLEKVISPIVTEKSARVFCILRGIFGEFMAIIPLVPVLALWSFFSMMVDLMENA